MTRHNKRLISIVVFDVKTDAGVKVTGQHHTEKQHNKYVQYIIVNEITPSQTSKKSTKQQQKKD